MVYRLSIILTVIGSIISLAGVLRFGYESKELNYVIIVGIVVVLVGLVGVPLITWQWMMKKELKP